MSGLDTGSQSASELPSELFLQNLALLPPHDLALSGRLSCKAAAQRFSKAHHRTVYIDQPLANHIVTTTTTTTTTNVQTASNMTTTTVASIITTRPGFMLSTEAAMPELTFRRKLLLLSRAAASGCAANVEVALQLLQPHVFFELLQSSRYCRAVLQEDRDDPMPDVGSAAVASGLAHLLPSLVQRCPGLVDPGRTLETAARHCDLAGLQAAWELLQQRLHPSLEEAAGRLPAQGMQKQLWQRMMAAAAGSTAPGATSKMERVLANTPAAYDCASILVHACGAAAASGDMARLHWLSEQGVNWRTPAALRALLEFAELGFVQRLEEEGGYVPAVKNAAWCCSSLVSAAAAAPRDSEAKLRWLKHQGASLTWAWEAINIAAEHGNLAAVKLLMQHRGGAGPPDYALYRAAAAGRITTATWLQQAGCTLTTSVFNKAFFRGDLPTVRWLLEAGSPRLAFQTLATAVRLWPRDSTADGERLVEAVRLLAAAGWPMGEADEEQLVARAASAGHPWAVCHGLLQPHGLHPVAVPHAVAKYAAAAG